MIESQNSDGHTPLHCFSIVQHNCRGSNLVFLTLFLLIRNRNVSFVCLQDPPLFQGSPLRAPGFQCYVSNIFGFKKRVATYVNLSLVKDFNYLCFSPAVDILRLVLSRNDGRPVLGGFDSFSLINTYNRQVDGVNTVKATDLFTDNPHPFLVVGDLNVHTLYTDPTRNMSSAERRKGEQYFRVAGLRGFAIINEPGVYTRTPENTNDRPSVIDYTLANRQLADFVKTWKTNIPHTGSDHTAMITSITSAPYVTARPSPNWGKITWKVKGKSNVVIEEEIKKLMSSAVNDEHATSLKWTRESEPDNAVDNFEFNLSLLIHTIKKHAAMKRPCRWSKPWWTPELTKLRKDFTCAARRAKMDPSLTQDAKEKKKPYQSTVKRAKAAHWRTFLENAKKNDVWTAHQFTKKRLDDTVPGGHVHKSASSLNESIMQHFFPLNPSLVALQQPAFVKLEERDKVDASEVSQALQKCSNSSAPGPDQVPYGVWKGIHAVNHHVILKLINHLLSWSIHPPSLKDSLGILLPKPAKGDYFAFASYRVIALMQTFSKIAERIINQRLIKFAKVNGLYSLRQTGSLPQRATFDAGISLRHWVQEAQAAGLKASTMFLDIKGGFDNVDHSTLLQRLRTKDVPRYMLKWISNFISYRQCTIIFLGFPREMKGINTGIPQGSALSPILFVIYVEPLHGCIDPSRELISSNVDDIQTTVSSSSWWMNSKPLEEAFTRIKNVATSMGLEFSTHKMDLIHWRTPREKVARSEHPIVVDGEYIQPTPKAVKWLGFHFENNHGTWTHYANRLALVQAAFDRIKRLSSPGGRLTPYSA